MTDDSQGSANQPPNRFIIQHWIKRGVEFQNNGKFHHALSCFVRVLELSPNRIDIWYKVGVCWQNLGYFGDAIADYESAIAIESRFLNRSISGVKPFSTIDLTLGLTKFVPIAA
ncbi:MAG: tetratricopeptide repeat protein [Limnospira sp.]